MGNLTILIALGMFGFMLLFMVFRLRSEDGEANHFLLQLICLGFLLGVFTLIGKVALDDTDPCAWNVANSTTSGSTTLYEYNYECSENTHTTSTTFYKMINWVVYVISLYTIIYFLYHLFKQLGWLGGGPRDGRRE